ncbi:MAG: class I SAM-dependent methyltransferase [Cellvibrionaceae bacterium]
MVDQILTTPNGDPAVLDWAEMELPGTWADQLDFRRPGDLWRFFRGIFASKRSQVRVPPELPGRERIPPYVLQEFHSLPNGNYSKRITRAYITGFDRSMLGAMTEAREHIAHVLRGCHSVLDVGCAGGRTARALREAGVADVWGLDPSPYLLQHAAKDNPDLRFVQAVAEDTGFGSERFDGLAVCFLLHELPPRYLSQALGEFNRILKPGGLLAVCEPSPDQVNKGSWELYRRYGWRGLYFGGLARFVFEPFLDAWHKNATAATFAKHGFQCLSDEVGMPLRHLLLRKASA